MQSQTDIAARKRQIEEGLTLQINKDPTPKNYYIRGRFYLQSDPQKACEDYIEALDRDANTAHNFEITQVVHQLSSEQRLEILNQIARNTLKIELKLSPDAKKLPTSILLDTTPETKQVMQFISEKKYKEALELLKKKLAEEESLNLLYILELARLSIHLKQWGYAETCAKVLAWLNRVSGNLAYVLISDYYRIRAIIAIEQGDTEKFEKIYRLLEQDKNGEQVKIFITSYLYDAAQQTMHKAYQQKDTDLLKKAESYINRLKTLKKNRIGENLAITLLHFIEKYLTDACDEKKPTVATETDCNDGTLHYEAAFNFFKSGELDKFEENIKYISATRVAQIIKNSIQEKMHSSPGDAKSEIRIHATPHDYFVLGAAREKTDVKETLYYFFKAIQSDISERKKELQLERELKDRILKFILRHEFKIENIKELKSLDHKQRKELANTLTQARKHHKNNQNQHAKTAYLSALALHSLNLNVFAELGDIYYAEKNYAQAEQYYFLGLWLSTRPEANDDLPPQKFLFRIRNVKIALGQLEYATQSHNSILIIASSPQNSQAPKQLRLKSRDELNKEFSEELIKHGQQSFDQKNYARALMLFQAASQSQFNAELRLKVSETFVRLERYTEAKMQLQTILNKDPSHTTAARLMKKLGKKLEESKEPMTPIELPYDGVSFGLPDPKHQLLFFEEKNEFSLLTIDAIREAAKKFHAEENYGKSLEYLNKITQSGHYLNLSELELRSKLHLHLNQQEAHAECVREIQFTLDYLKKYPTMELAAGPAYAAYKAHKKSDLVQACKHAEQALKQNPRDEITICIRANALIEKGNEPIIHLAIKDIEVLRALNPNSAYYEFLLARCYYALLKKRETLEHLLLAMDKANDVGDKFSHEDLFKLILFAIRSPELKSSQPITEEEAYAKAQEYMQKQSYKNAIRCFHITLQLNPSRPIYAELSLAHQEACVKHPALSEDNLSYAHFCLTAAIWSLKFNNHAVPTEYYFRRRDLRIALADSLGHQRDHRTIIAAKQDDAQFDVLKYKKTYSKLLIKRGKELLQKKDFNNAKLFLNDALEVIDDDNDIENDGFTFKSDNVEIYLSLAQLHSTISQFDTALSYLTIAKQGGCDPELLKAQQLAIEKSQKQSVFVEPKETKSPAKKTKQDSPKKVKPIPTSLPLDLQKEIDQHLEKQKRIYEEQETKAQQEKALLAQKKVEETEQKKQSELAKQKQRFAAINEAREESNKKKNKQRKADRAAKLKQRKPKPKPIAEVKEESAEEIPQEQEPDSLAIELPQEQEPETICTPLESIIKKRLDVTPEPLLLPETKPAEKIKTEFKTESKAESKPKTWPDIKQAIAVTTIPITPYEKYIYTTLKKTGCSVLMVGGTVRDRAWHELNKKSMPDAVPENLNKDQDIDFVVTASHNEIAQLLPAAKFHSTSFELEEKDKPKVDIRISHYPTMLDDTNSRGLTIDGFMALIDEEKEEATVLARRPESLSDLKQGLLCLMQPTAIQNDLIIAFRAVKTAGQYKHFKLSQEIATLLEKMTYESLSSMITNLQFYNYKPTRLNHWILKQLTGPNAVTVFTAFIKTNFWHKLLPPEYANSIVMDQAWLLQQLRYSNNNPDDIYMMFINSILKIRKQKMTVENVKVIIEGCPLFKNQLGLKDIAHLIVLFKILQFYRGETRREQTESKKLIDSQILQKATQQYPVSAIPQALFSPRKLLSNGLTNSHSPSSSHTDYRPLS